jgi:hypothetical protein
VASLKPPARKVTPVPKVPLMLDLLRDLPIAERASKNQSDDLSMFEFAVLAAVLFAATTAWFDRIKEQAFAAGRHKLKHKKQGLRAYKQEKRGYRIDRYLGVDPGEHPRKPFTTEEYEFGRLDDLVTFNETKRLRAKNVTQIMRYIGRREYDRRYRQLTKQGPPQIITVELSRDGLLGSVGLARNGLNRRQLASALARLREPIDRQHRYGALLADCTSLPFGHLQLRVRGVWLTPPFCSVALPLPLRSVTALRLYLFLQRINTWRSNQTSIRPTNLHDYIGSSVRRQGRAETQLEQALAAVNEVRKMQQREPYECEVEDGQIRFQTAKPDLPDEDDDGPELPVRPSRKSRQRRELLRAQVEEAERRQWLEEYQPCGVRRRFDVNKIRRQTGFGPGGRKTDS